MLRTDVRLLQAALREPFLQDETFAQDQPRKSFFGGSLPKTLHRRSSHRGGAPPPWGGKVTRPPAPYGNLKMFSK